MPLLDDSDFRELLLRFAVAVVAGGAVGWDREMRGKQAGLRTHMLVALGAALFVMLPLTLAGGSADAVSRVAQGVATGVGFLGAGDIVREWREEGNRPRSTGGGEPDRRAEPTVRGLTSAAAIWVTAALGLLAGVGRWRSSLIGAAVTLLTLRVLLRAERRGD